MTELHPNTSEKEKVDYHQAIQKALKVLQHLVPFSSFFVKGEENKSFFDLVPEQKPYPDDPEEIDPELLQSADAKLLAEKVNQLMLGQYRIEANKIYDFNHREMVKTEVVGSMLKFLSGVIDSMALFTVLAIVPDPYVIKTPMDFAAIYGVTVIAKGFIHGFLRPVAQTILNPSLAYEQLAADALARDWSEEEPLVDELAADDALAAQGTEQ